MPEIPTIPFGEYQISRIMIGHNPLCGNSHFSEEMSRDMLEYFTAEQVVSVFHRCQAAGMNTIQARGDYHRVLHWLELFRREGGKMHWIAQTASEMSDIFQNIRIIAAAGAIGTYHHGTQTDKFWHAGEIDKTLDYLKCIRDNGMQVGLGTHIPEVIEYAETHDWDVDFYMTCFYNLSRQERESNLVAGKFGVQEEEFLESDPPKMCRVIQQTPKTCLAFKILGASRLCTTQESVQQAFDFAFANIKPKDAVVVGMFPKYLDQISLNVQYTLQAIKKANPKVNHV